MSQKGKPKPAANNTLFKYFQKSPAQSSPNSSLIKTPNPPANTTPKVEKKSANAAKNESRFVKRLNATSDGESGDEVKPKKKRRRIVSHSDESEQENSDGNKMDVDEVATPKSKTASQVSKFEYQNSPNVTAPSSTSKTKKEIQKDKDFAVIDKTELWMHEKLEWLKPDKIKDASGKRSNHPDYNPRTLFVPEQFMKEQTPAMRQWWTLKRDYFDTVLFFKVGKFYELFHQDCLIGVKELNFVFMKGAHAHTGFPEQAFDEKASILIEKGYNVARTEQTENPDMMEIRCKKNNTFSKFDKVVNREICQITNKGTRVFGQQMKMTPNFGPAYLMVLAEEKKCNSSRYGICFVDTSIGDFTIGEFDDDSQCSRLLTLLSHHSPVLFLHSRNNLAAHTAKVVKVNLAHALKEKLSNDNMWNAEKTIKYLRENLYSDEESWPEALSAMIKDSAPLPEYKLVLKALGGCLWYLEYFFLVQQVLSSASFKIYTPPDIQALPGKGVGSNEMKHMVLDNITLANLRVNGPENTLYTTLNYCCTPFGKRLLQQWVCSPSCQMDVIKMRQVAINELLENSEMLQSTRELLGKLPDLEKYVAQIHALGNDKKGHPDSRAILYEMATYGKKKINDFAATLKGFETVMQIPKIFLDCSSKLLNHLTQLNPDGSFIKMTEQLKYFKSAFNFEEAKKTGYIVPEKGVDLDYDAVMESIDDIDKELKQYLKEQEKFFGCKLAYFGNEKKRFQLEVPENACKKATSEYTLESSRKGKPPVKRYYTEELKDLLKRQIQAEDKKKAAMTDIARKIFAKFGEHHGKWKHIVGLVSQLDVLVSLAEFARNLNYSCTPEVCEMVDSKPVLIIEDGLHPLMAQLDDFIPNGITCPNGTAYLELITGPNMGGKSTLMRQIGLLCVMAQIGSRVPANAMQVTLCDRIFTRLGANDNIMTGHSTFLVELNETAAILKHCTKSSLVLLDELGRGTSTYDGTAIATAVVNFLAETKCRTLFSTHYHNLVDGFHADNRINLGHMACMVENENSDDVTKENVTFLYKYTAGACPKSYGFNAAKLAGMNVDIIRRAYEISRQVEAKALERRIISKILKKVDSVDITSLIQKFSACFAKKDK